MNSKLSHEGYFLQDNRESPGVPDALVIPLGLPPGAGRGLFESSCFTCSHCERVVVNGPMRKRPRSWCKKCDHYICDECGAKLFLTGVCFPFKARAAEIVNEAAKHPDDPLPTRLITF